MQQIDATILKNEQIGPDIVRLTLNAPAIAAQAKPGQFINVKTGPGFDPLLRRPFSIHDAAADGTIQVIFKVLGKGTQELATTPPGARLNLVGPLGNHFTCHEGPVALVGGGLGIAPLLLLAKSLLAAGRNRQDLTLILAARTKTELACFLPAFEALHLIPHLATDDGSLGHHGLITDLMPKTIDETLNWQICTCGPYPMMRAVAAIGREKGWPCQVSLETMMACGISACLGCAVPASVSDAKGRHYLHVCQDGPIFQEGDIQW